MESSSTTDPQTRLSPQDPDYTADPVRWRILTVLLTVIFMSLVSVSIVNVALPSIQRDLGASDSAMQWVLSGYALTFGVVLVAAGRAGDIMGRGGFFLIGVVVFTLSSIAAGLAPDAKWLNAARFVQGIGSGLLNPQGVGMIQQYFRGAERGRAFGYFGTVVGFSVAIGPVLGGFLIEVFGPGLGWRSTFLVNVPIGILAFILGLIWFPKPLIRRPSQPRRGQPPSGHGLWSLDPVGSLLLGLAVLAILFPFMDHESGGRIWLLVLAGVALVYLWVEWERFYTRIGHSPMVNLKIFSTRSFTNGTIIVMLYFLGMTSIWVLVALYVQNGNGMTALQSGVFGIPSALLSAWAADWAGRRVMRYGRRIVIAGLVLAVTGMLMSIGVIILHEMGLASVWWLMLSLSFVGLAQGSVISPNQTLTLADVPLDYAGSSGAIMQTGQRIGTSVGIAMVTAVVFSLVTKGQSWAIATVIGFVLITAVIALALAFAVKDQWDRNRNSHLF